MSARVASSPCGRRPYKVCQKLKGQFSNIKASRPLILQKKKKRRDFGQFPRQILFLLSLISLPNISKHIQTSPNTFDSSLFYNHNVVFLHSIFLSLIPYLGFEVQEYRCSSLVIIHTLFFSQLFLAFSCSIIYFISFPSMFLLPSMFPCFCHDLSL